MVRLSSLRPWGLSGRPAGGPLWGNILRNPVGDVWAANLRRCGRNKQAAEQSDASADDSRHFERAVGVETANCAKTAHALAFMGKSASSLGIRSAT